MRRLIVSNITDGVRAASDAFLKSGFSFLSIIIVVCAVLLANSHARGESALSVLDPDRRVVLPSAPTDGIFKQRRSLRVLQVDEWEITPDDVSHVDAALSSVLKSERVGDGLATTPNYYRQYVPARLHQSRAIYVNGFNQTESDMFPNRGISPDRWKHSLVITYGGGCAFWYGIYLIDEGRFLILDHKNNRHIICNGPK